MADQAAPAEPASAEGFARLFLYAVEILGDPGAAELLVSEATARAFRWARPAPGQAPPRGPLLKAITALAHGPMGRTGRPPLAAALRVEGQHFDEGIEQALAGLVGRERAALFLVLLEELPYEACADILGTTPANAGHLVWRARRALRSRLVGEHAAAPGAEGQVPPPAEHRISRVLRSDCAQTGPFISAAIDGQLGGRQLELLGAHLESCPACAEERARLSQVSAAVKGHWAALAARLTAGGWTRRASRVIALGREAGSRGPREARMKLGIGVACLLAVTAVVAVYAAVTRGVSEAVVGLEGPCSRRSGRIRAEGPAQVRLFDGSTLRLSEGAVVRPSRGRGARRPRVKLLAGAVTVLVAAGRGPLVCESAAGRAEAAGGEFTARLAARSAEGQPLEIELERAKALAGGERLALAVESATATVKLAGEYGGEVEIPPGGAGLIPVSEAARPLALPGTWVGLEPGGAAPPSRTGAALGCDRGAALLVLFGGRAEKGAARPAAGAPGATPPPTELNDLWTYDPLIGRWMEMSVSTGADKWLAAWGGRPPGERPADRPAPQLPGALLADPRGRGLWLYAGRIGPLALPELWYTEAFGTWQRYPAAVSGAGSRPPPLGRGGAALAASVQAGGVVLFGGQLGDRVLGDAWLFDVSAGAWRPLAWRGAGPEPRVGAALAADRDGRRLYLFGGRAANGAVLDDTWCLDLAAVGGSESRPPKTESPVTWARLKAGPAPEARAGAAMACEEAGGKVVLFGGRPRLGSPLADTWLLDPDKGQWSRLLSPGGPGADEFFAPAMAWHPQCRALILYARGGLWSLRL